jgi:arylsulfatase A-like enzyme
VERGKALMWENRFPVYGHVLDRSPILAIRKGRWKLLVNPDGSRTELYDPAADPTEMNNLAAREPDTVRALRAEALAWQSTLPKGPVDPQAGRNDYPWPASAPK